MTIRTYSHDLQGRKNALIFFKMDVNPLLVEIISTDGIKRKIEVPPKRSFAVKVTPKDSKITVSYDSYSPEFPGRITERLMRNSQVGTIKFKEITTSKKRIRIRIDADYDQNSVIYVRVVFNTFLNNDYQVESGIGFTSIFGTEVSPDDSFESLTTYESKDFKTISFFESGAIDISEDVDYARLQVELVCMSKINTASPVIKQATIIGIE
jgi:hypothetical protein